MTRQHSILHPTTRHLKVRAAVGGALHNAQLGSSLERERGGGKSDARGCRSGCALRKHSPVRVEQRRPAHQRHSGAAGSGRDVCKRTDRNERAHQPLLQPRAAVVARGVAVHQAEERERRCELESATARPRQSSKRQQRGAAHSHHVQIELPRCGQRRGHAELRHKRREEPRDRRSRNAASHGSHDCSLGGLDARRGRSCRLRRCNDAQATARATARVRRPRAAARVRRRGAGAKCSPLRRMKAGEQERVGRRSAEHAAQLHHTA